MKGKDFMKKSVIYALLLSFVLQSSAVFAAENTKNTNNAEKFEAVAPVWEEYVPEKYQNPRNFTRGKSIAELSVGIFLTDLLITAPIGIPMIVHSTTKLKNKSYYDKKLVFEQGLEEAEKYTDPVEKQKYYDNLVKKCKLKEENRQKYLAKQAKEEKKAQEKAQKEAEKSAEKIQENTDKTPQGD